jgi:hypothetical protein
MMYARKKYNYFVNDPVDLCRISFLLRMIFRSRHIQPYRCPVAPDAQIPCRGELNMRLLVSANPDPFDLVVLRKVRGVLPAVSTQHVKPP